MESKSRAKAAVHLERTARVQRDGSPLEVRDGTAEQYQEQHVGAALYGLRSSADSLELRGLVAAVRAHGWVAHRGQSNRDVAWEGSCPNEPAVGDRPRNLTALRMRRERMKRLKPGESISLTYLAFEDPHR